MKLSDIRRHILRSSRALLCLTTLAMVGCDTIWEGEGDCTRVYQVSFTYTMNIKNTDTFAKEVESVSLFVFDQSGKLVAAKTDAGEALGTGNYKMSFDNIEPGTYDLIAWAGLTDNDSFSLIGGDSPVSKEDLVCRLNRLYDESNAAYSKKQLGALYHGMAERVEFTEHYGVNHVTTIDLTKNTNTVRLVLYNEDGRPLRENEFHFTITDNNGTMNYDNSLLDDEVIVYSEWTKKTDMLESPEQQMRSDEVKTNYCVVAEIDLARLVLGQKPVLTVVQDGKDEPIIRLSLINLLLVAKGEVRESMDSQEYLDRQDDYTIFFKLDDNNEWYTNGVVFVNGWKMVFNNTDI